MIRLAEGNMSQGLRAGVMAAPAPRRTLTKEADEELALFLEMRKLEKDRSNKPQHNAGEIDLPLGPKPGIAPLFKITKARMDEFLNSDRGKNDYDWLLTPPGTPLLPSSDTGYRRSPISSNETPKACPTMLRSKLVNAPDSLRDTLLPRSAFNSSGMGILRPSSAGGRNRTRPATPTGRPTIPAAPITTSRPSTPTSRAALHAKSQAPSRSSTPVRSSTPTSRSSVLATSNHASRSVTPTRRPSAPYNTSTVSAPPNRPVGRSASTAAKSSAPSRGSSPTIRSGPLKPSDIPGFSLDAPPNLRTSLPDRPASASRGRHGAPTRRSSSVEPGPGVRPRHQSCSPSRGRAPNGSIQKVNSVQTPSRLQQKGGDVNPIAIGNRMVEQTVNMIRLVPPKQDDYQSTYSNLSTKSSLSPGNVFRRSLSKQSLDMAFRHMDIRRTIPSYLKPGTANASASSSLYSTRSGPARSRTSSVSNSPLATSSTTSSERSVNNHHMIGLDGSEVEDDIISEKGSICSTVSITR